MKDLKQVYIVPRDYEYNLRAAQLLAKLIGCECLFHEKAHDFAMMYNQCIRFTSVFGNVSVYEKRSKGYTPITLEELEAFDSGDDGYLEYINETLRKWEAAFSKITHSNELEGAHFDLIQAYTSMRDKLTPPKTQ